MRRLMVSSVLCAVLAAVPSVRAQDKKGEEVQFETADKVEIRGTFYASSKPKAPCVVLLHNVGGNRQQEGWDKLAQALSKDFAVLSFDFRGHGDSTSVDPTFWKVGANTMIKGAAKTPSKISYKDFPDAYYPMLINDLAAARRFLDQQNDAGACNSSSIIVIGARRRGDRRFLDFDGVGQAKTHANRFRHLRRRSE